MTSRCKTWTTGPEKSWMGSNKEITNTMKDRVINWGVQYVKEYVSFKNRAEKDSKQIAKIMEKSAY